MKVRASVEDFKQQFPRFSPAYLPVYINGKTYFMGDVVFYEEQFYKCKVASTQENPTVTTDWELHNSNVLYYTQDSDIQSAFAEASINFNQDLFDDCNKARMVLLYLTAYYLTVDFNNATGGNSGIVQSKSVGSVSESYAIPQWMLNNATLSMYASNGYGRKYLTMIRPYLIGNIILSKGRTTAD